MISPHTKMSSKLVILCCFVALSHAVPRRVARIAGGQDAAPAQYPYYASLYYRDTLAHHPIAFCGGAILNNQWIITAANCVSQVKEPNDIVVKAGNIYYAKSTDEEQVYKAVAGFIHPQYQESTGPYDIGLLKLESPLKFNKHVSGIALAEAGSIPTGEGVITGLGSLKHMINSQFPDSLQYVKLPIISNDVCKKHIERILGIYADILDLDDGLRFCTAPTKTNQGYCLHDTGDPFVDERSGKLIGVATFAFAADCETPGTPSIYIRVSAFNNWIQETITKNN